MILPILFISSIVKSPSHCKVSPSYKLNDI